MLRVNPLKWVWPESDVAKGRPPRRFEWFGKQLEAIDVQRSRPLFLFGAGNRAGKSEWAVRKTIGTALGVDYALMHTLPQDPSTWLLGKAKTIWAVTTTYADSRETQQRLVWERTPRCLIEKGYRYLPKTGFYNNLLVFKNGSRIVFKTAEQGLETFERESIDLAWIDEWIPAVYINALMVRCADRAGQVIITTWPRDPEIQDIFVEGRGAPGLEQKLGKQDVGAVWGGMEDNPLVPRDYIKLLLRKLPPDEAAGRIYGKFAFKSGLVYADFVERVHLESGELPLATDWTRFEAIDPGWDNPCAVLFGGVDSSGIVHCYDEIYERHRTVGELAALIFAKRWEHAGALTPAEVLEFRRRTLRQPGEQWDTPDAVERAHESIRETLDAWRRRCGDCRPRLTVCDEYGKQVNQSMTGSLIAQLGRFGITAVPASNRNREAQRARVRDMLRPIEGLVRLRIDWRCEWLRWELAHFRHKDKDDATGEHLGDRERVIDANNHLCAALEYLLDADPKYRPPEAAPAPPGSLLDMHERFVEAPKRGKDSWRRRG